MALPEDSILINANMAWEILFQDPETKKELRPICAPAYKENGLVLDVESKDGTVKMRHTIISEEM